MVASFLLLPLATALALLFMTNPQSIVRKIMAIASCTLQLVLSGIAIYGGLNGKNYISLIGGWAAPYGIALVIDLFSAMMLFATLAVYLSIIFYSFFEKMKPHNSFMQLPLIFFLQMGTNLVLITGDFFNLFVAFEIMLTSSYGLLSLHAHGLKVKSIYSYFSVNLAGSLIFLCGAAMVYGYTGNLNMAALAAFFEAKGSDPLLIAFAWLMFCVCGLKMGIFPLYFWLPDSYPNLPYSLAALFGGILSKVGVYVLMRLFITILPHDLTIIKEWMIVLSTLTMLLGVLGAVSKTSIKGILSYHIVSQIGYIALAVAIFTPLSLTAALLFTIHNMWVKSSLFLYGGIAGQFFRTDKLSEMSGGWQSMPISCCFFLLQALSLAGIPPLSGFWGKYLIISESFWSAHIIPAVIAIITSWMTLFSMLKIWTGAFWGKAKEMRRTSFFSPAKQLAFSGVGLVILSFTLGLGAEYALRFSKEAVMQLLDKRSYIDSVYLYAEKDRRSFP